MQRISINYEFKIILSLRLDILSSIEEEGISVSLFHLKTNNRITYIFGVFSS